MRKKKQQCTKPSKTDMMSAAGTTRTCIGRSDLQPQISLPAVERHTVHLDEQQEPTENPPRHRDKKATLQLLKWPHYEISDGCRSRLRFFAAPRQCIKAENTAGKISAASRAVQQGYNSMEEQSRSRRRKLVSLILVHLHEAAFQQSIRG
jgi:hypothetical protein